MGHQREDHGDAGRGQQQHREQGEEPAPTPRGGRVGRPVRAEGSPVFVVGLVFVVGPVFSVCRVFFEGRVFGRVFFEGRVVTGRGSVNSGAGARVRAGSVSRRSAAVSERPGGSAGAGAVPTDGVSAEGGARSGSAGACRWFCGVRFFGGVGFFCRSDRRGGERGAPEPARHALRLVIGGGLVGVGLRIGPRIGKGVEVLGRDEQLPVARATALGGHDRPGPVGGLAPALSVVRRLRGGCRPARARRSVSLPVRLP